MTDTAENAVGAARDHAAKGRTAMPRPRPFVSQFVYSTFYFSSYCVVFPALFVANAVPGFGALADGLTDGTYAACEAVRDGKARRAAKKVAAHDPDRQQVEQKGVEGLAAVS
jgi:hypothetical protein